ncbi:MAG: FAD-binding oxidoreductase [Pseudohaliea sp.]
MSDSSAGHDDAQELPAAALAAFREAVGEAHVVIDAGTRRRYETATFATSARVPAIVRPGSVAEVQQCLQVANAHGVPVYPVSTGLNTGYGSAVPARSGCVVLELRRLDRILDYDPGLGCVTIEPGVTQEQLFRFLQERDAPFWLDVTGAYPGHSLIGNIAERGFGHTTYSDHYAHLGAMEVVLPQGELVGTGFGQYRDAKATGYYRWGLGPHFDGLFTQSNLGIIVKATLWLMPRPAYTQFFAARVDRDEDLPLLIEALKPLRLDGTITSAMHIGNDYKVISAIQGYPWEAAGGETPLPRDVLAAKSKEWDCGPWNASGALYGTRAEVALARRKLKAALKGKVSRLQFLDERLLGLAKRFARPYSWLTGLNLNEMLKMVEPVFGMTRGVPSAGMLPSNYWRKPGPLPAVSPDLSPEADRCGVFWIAPVAPTSGAHAAAVWAIVRDTMLHRGFEPAVSITLLTERTLDCVVNISYDRDVPGEDERAMACHDALLERLCAEGYYPYRLGIQSSGKMPPREAGWERLMAGLRRELDPNGILAPGRYLD